MFYIIYYNPTKAIQSGCECLQMKARVEAHNSDTYIRNHTDFTKTNTPVPQMCVMCIYIHI